MRHFLENSSINNESEYSCFTPQDFNSSIEFYDCYQYVLKHKSFFGACGLFLTFSVIIANLVVIVILLRKNEINMFDQILINHALINGWAGVYNISLQHFVNVFGYWPLGYTTSVVWTLLDRAQHIITGLNMLYLSWTRLRAIESPKNYQNEILMKRPLIVMGTIWFQGYLIWGVVVIKFGVVEYSTEINYDTSGDTINTILFILFWFIPLLATLIIAIKIIAHLRIRSKKRVSLGVFTRKTRISSAVRLESFSSGSNTELREKINLKKIFHKILSFKASSLNAKTKYAIILAIFLSLWFPCCVLSILCPFISVETADAFDIGINWVTNLACLTDPVVVLILNSNLSRKKSL